MENVVVPIAVGYSDGNGVVVGDMLITAGHVVNKGDDDAAFEATLRKALKSVASKYPGLGVEKSGEKEWKVTIPADIVKTHEQRFSSVMKVYLNYLIDGEIPAWERSHMISKYYTTTTALEVAKK